MSKEKAFPNGSISFDVTCNEEGAAFFRRMMEDHQKIEDAVRERINELFEEFVQVGGEKKDEAYNTVLNLFSLGYQLGWNDRKDVIDNMKGDKK